MHFYFLEMFQRTYNKYALYFKHSKTKFGYVDTAYNIPQYMLLSIVCSKASLWCLYFINEIHDQNVKNIQLGIVLFIKKNLIYS